MNSLGICLSLLGITLVLASLSVTLHRIADALEERNQSNNNRPK